jgi:U3 small nucleolar RNA-associated protein 3
MSPAPVDCIVKYYLTNSRRKMFEAKKKKLGSIRAVYSGGEKKGGYRGELSGIKTNLVKGVQL